MSCFQLRHVLKRCCFVQYDSDTRGRWKNSRRQHETYADISIPYIDAKVAAALCKGGPITYEVVPESGISDGWIIDHVTPFRASSGISREVCLLFGRAMLWRIFDTCRDSLVPNEQKARIKAAYGDIAHNTLEQGTNPVKKVPLVVGGLDAEVIIERLEPGPTDGTAAEPVRATRDQRLALLTSQIHSLRRDHQDSCAQTDRQFQASVSNIWLYSYYCMYSHFHSFRCYACNFDVLTKMSLSS